MSIEKYSELRDADGLVRINAKRPVMKDIELSKININVSRNHRDEAEVYLNTNPDMMSLMDSLKIQGMIPGYEPTVHDEGNGEYDMLIGHRRGTAAKHLGWKTITCKVLSGLTDEQKLMVIFGPREVAEGTIGEFKQVKALLAIGLSRVAVAQKLMWKSGRNQKDNTNLVQHYAQLLALPLEVQEEWKQQQRKVPSKNLTMPTLTAKVVGDLYQAMGKDVAQFKKTEGVEGSVTADGPELRAEIFNLKKEGITTKAAKEVRKVTISVLESYHSQVSNNVFKQWILGIAGTKGINFGPMLGRIDDACNLAMPNPKPADAPKEVEEIFSPESAITEPESTSIETIFTPTLPETAEEPVEIISEGTKVKVKSGKRS